jgi:amino acid transporter
VTANFVLGVAILVVAVAVAVGVMLYVRTRAPEGSFFSDGDRASGVFGVLATGFAIFAGFVIFLAFTTYDQSRAGAEAEALLVVQQFETAQFLAPETRDRLAGEIICYGRSVVDREWPEMQEGDLDEAINPWGIALFRTIRAADPSGTVQETAFAKWLDQTSDREEARRDRIHGAAGITPTTIWIVLLLSASIVFCFMLFFADPAELKRSQAMLVGSATTIVVVTLLAIYALDNPYRPGLGSIQPDAMERSLAILDEAQADLGITIDLPCDENGTAK